MSDDALYVVQQRPVTKHERIIIEQQKKILALEQELRRVRQDLADALGLTEE